MFIVLAAICTFGPKLSLQNKVKAMKARMEKVVLAQNNQIISYDMFGYRCYSPCRDYKC